MAAVPKDHEAWRVRATVLQLQNKLTAADESGAPAPLKVIRKLPYWLANGVEMAQLFLMKPIRSEQFQPAVR